MNSKTKRIFTVFTLILIVLMLLTMPVLAKNLRKTIDITYRDIKIFVDGEIVIPKDAAGKVVEPFIHEGTTYLPVRAISEALGKPVEWDGVSSSIYIGESIPQAITEITVSTAEELVAALGSNRRILLKEGVYNLTKVSPGYINNTGVSYREIYDGPELTLAGIHNLTIQGIGDKQSEIIIEPRYAFVMHFRGCTNISIANIKAGHTDSGYCAGGVFEFENSSGIKIDNTLMYGCGTYGLSIQSVIDMKVTKSSIYECTYGIMRVLNSADISFKDCIFRDNTGFDMVGVGNTIGFTIDSCEFRGNISDTSYISYPMFLISQSENVVVKNTKFVNNIADKLIDNDNIKFDASNTFINNSFHKTK